MASKFKYYLFVALLILGISSSAQNTDYHFVKSVNYFCDSVLIEKGEYIFSFNQLFSSASISTLKKANVGVQLKTQFDTFNFTANTLTNDSEHPSGFVIFSQSIDNFILVVERTTYFKIELFYAPKINIKNNAQLYKLEACIKPGLIERSVWRDGLADPVPGRTSTQVKHCIIHHAASSNANTDYTAVVRNIYLLHTQSNGWDDIGYNYLIAPDGTIYAGRDPLGVDDEDNIQGAHFCAKNSGTMGICLIGNYQEIEPTDTMISSLISVLSWKLHKENISAYDEFNHPDTNSDPLGSIALHRNGCSTVCPGDSVALQLDYIKSLVDAELSACINVGIKPVSSNTNINIYPNPSYGKFSVSGIVKPAEYFLTDAYGRVVKKGIITSTNNTILHSANGIYTLCFFHGEETILRKLVIISE